MLNYEKLYKFLMVVRKAGIELSIKVDMLGIKFDINYDTFSLSNWEKTIDSMQDEDMITSDEKVQFTNLMFSILYELKYLDDSRNDELIKDLSNFAIESGRDSELYILNFDEENKKEKYNG